MGLKCVIYMGEVDIERQRPNVERMRILGADIRPATSGSKTLKDATNEAMRHWINNPDDTHYIIGSVVGPHPYPDMVARFQSVISEELLVQLNKVEGRDYPDFIIACVGGGSNAAGIFYHYLENSKVKLVGVEAAGLGVSTNKSAATTKLGKKGVLHGSKTLLMQDENGQVTEPYSISAGLDYPGIGPLHAHLSDSNRGIYISVEDDEAMNAGIELPVLDQSISAACLIIIAPTITKAGAAANVGICLNNPASSRPDSIITPTVTAVRPVFPPSSTPAADSMYVVVVLVPNTAPTTVAPASAMKASSIIKPHTSRSSSCASGSAKIPLAAFFLIRKKA